MKWFKQWTPAGVVLAGLLIVWELVSYLEIIPRFMLPPLSQVMLVLIQEFPLLLQHAQTTLFEAFIGLLISCLLAAVLAIGMDRFALFKRALYPLLIITQAVPTVAIAPLLVLWFGYDTIGKVVLIVVVCFFPITVSLIEGFQSVDKDFLTLMRTLNAPYHFVLWHVKWPAALPSFFSGLKIAASYAVVGAVIAGWLGGDRGLGVYMTRARKTFAYDKTFAVILLTVCVSLMLSGILKLVHKRVTKWNQIKER